MGVKRMALIPLAVIQTQELVESCTHTRQYMGFREADLFIRNDSDIIQTESDQANNP